MDGSLPGSSVNGILQARILEWVAISFSRESSQPRDRTRSPALQADSLPAEPQGKLKNKAVGSLSLLQGIFPIHESSQGLLHCRQNLYQLSDQGDSMEMPNLTHLVGTKDYIMGDCSLFKTKYIFLGCQKESQAAVE